MFTDSRGYLLDDLFDNPRGDMLDDRSGNLFDVRLRVDPLNVEREDGTLVTTIE